MCLGRWIKAVARRCGSRWLKRRSPKSNRCLLAWNWKTIKSIYCRSLSAADQVAEDYRTVGLSLRAHPMSFHRAALDELDVTTCKGLKEAGNNHRVAVAGLVILRQRPSTAKGITFVTIEDETGSANLIVKKSVWERHYKIARRSSAWLAYGKVETKGAITHVIVNRIADMSSQLSEINLKARDFR